MIYTSNKPQAKIITQWTLYSSTNITNIQKELLRVQVSLLSHYLQLLKIISTGTLYSSTKSFFYYKKQQATSRQPAARCLFIFFLFKKTTSNKPAASSPVNA